MKVADIREHVEQAKNNAAEEEAALKWDQVLAYAERQTPDAPDRNPPRFRERTRRAISAAGGLAHMRDCDRESLTWARKRFIEEYVRLEELRKDEYLLPPGEVRRLLEEVASAKSVEHLLSAPKASGTEARAQDGGSRHPEASGHSEGK